MTKILVIDDEEDLCEILKFNLENIGYEVDSTTSAESALKMDISSYNLLILDVMMDEMSGFTLASRLKKDPSTASVPIIFITAKDTENDILTGFNLGADDYISKPFRLSEVAARVKAVLRRTAEKKESKSVTVNEEQTLSCENLVLNLQTKTVTLNKIEVILTKKEYDLLYFLLKNRGRIFSREEILNHVWPNDVNVLERSVDVNIARLRKKIGEYSDYIISRSGYGYCFKS